MTDRSELAFWIALGALAGGIIGIIGTIATAGLLALDFPSRWYTLVPDHAPIPVAFSDEVVLESDIVPPDVTEVSGKAKFLSDSSQRLGHAALGYVISVAANSLDQSTLPEKYKKEINLEGQNYLPLREATYEVDLRYVCLTETDLSYSLCARRNTTSSRGRLLRFKLTLNLLLQGSWPI